MSAPSKTLFLVRHAKSSWKDTGVADHDRPLNTRGLRDAPMMAARVAARPDRPELIVASSALRALTTAELMAAGLGLRPTDVLVHDQLYDAEPDALLDVIRGVHDQVTTVMLVAHNPGVTETATLLTGAPIANVPTCGIVVLGFRTESWAAVRRQSATLLDFDYPKRENT